MIALNCSSCGKSLKVKDDLAGKKVKCPGCGKPAAVPQPATSVGPPADARDERTLPPKVVGKESLSDAGGHTALGAGQAENTQAISSQSHSAELTDFLGPPQAPDEIGRLGGFRILKILGQGGMGVVFQGEDPRLGRKVAIKAMLPHLAGSKSSQERFLREARSAAALEHDHIVPILQVGEDCGAPFIVMPFLQGEPLDERLKRETLMPLAEVLRIGRETAKGLAAAHKRGLIHRDIKPANLWLEGDEARVKILDFGLARAAAEDSHLTQSGAIVGTPAYMAPEQAGGEKVDHRCDLFSLGCVLYRMCTGNMPFKGKDSISTLVAVASHDPPPPASINAELPAELSDLVMQLLAKKPEERPQSAQAVADALQEIEVSFGGEPKTTRTAKMKVVGKTQSLPKPAAGKQRSKGRLPLLIGGGVLGLGVLGLVVFVLASRERQRPENDSKQAATSSREFTNSLGMDFVLVPKGKSWLGGGVGKPGNKEVEIKEDFYLGKYEVTQEEWEKIVGHNPSNFKTVAGISKEDQKRFPVEMVSWDDCQVFLNGLNQQAKDPGWLYRLPKADEWEYACRGGPMKDKSEIASDFYLEKPTNTLLPHQANFAHDKGLKRTTKVGSYPSNRLGLFDMHGNVMEWCNDSERASDGAARRVFKGGDWGNIMGYCPAAARFVNTPTYRIGNVGLRLARVPVGKEIVSLVKPPDAKLPKVTLPKSAPPGPLDRLNPANIAVSERFPWQPKELAALLGDERQRHWGWVFPVAFDPDGKRIASASGGGDNAIRLWDAKRMQVQTVLTGHAGPITSVAFSADGKTLASGSHDLTVRLWDVAATTPKERGVLGKHGGWVNSVAFTPSGKTLAAGLEDGTVRLWDLSGAEPREGALLKAHAAPAYSVAISLDGKKLASGGGKTVRLWDLKGADAVPKAVLKHPDPIGSVISVAFGPNAQLLASSGLDGSVRLWDISGEQPAEKDLVRHSGPVLMLKFAPDGKTLASASADWTVRVWDLAGGKLSERAILRGHLAAVNCVAFAADGKTLASASSDFSVRLWDFGPSKIVERPAPQQILGVLSLAVAPDGMSLLAPCKDGKVRLWFPTEQDPKPRIVYSAPDGASPADINAWSGAFAPDGKRFAIGGFDSAVHLWDLEQGNAKEQIPLKGHAGRVLAAAFSPDGRTLASGSADATIRLWDLNAGMFNESEILKGHSNVVNAVTFSPDGKTLASGGAGGIIRLWNVTGPKASERTVLKLGAGDLKCLAFAPNGGILAAASPSLGIKLWNLDGQQPQELPALVQPGSAAVTFSPDGTTLAVASETRGAGGGIEGQVRLWNIGNRQEIRSWRLPGQVSLAFAPDGRHLFTGNGNGSVYVLRLASPPK